MDIKEGISTKREIEEEKGIGQEGREEKLKRKRYHELRLTGTRKKRQESLRNFELSMVIVHLYFSQ